MFPLRSKLFIISRLTTPLNFTDLNSYSTEISSENKFFDMYIVKEKATRKFLMQNFLPGMFKMTNFDRFHREAMGVRGLLSISRLLVYFFDELKDHLVPLFLLAGGVNAFAGVLLTSISKLELHIFVLFDTHHGSCLYFIDYKIRRKVFFQIAILDILMLIVI